MSCVDALNDTKVEDQNVEFKLQRDKTDCSSCLGLLPVPTKNYRATNLGIDKIFILPDGIHYLGKKNYTM